MAAHGVSEAVRMFSALSAARRVEIVGLLARRTLCVGALSNLLGISIGAVSQHLRILRDAGIVRADRRGYFVHYQLAPDVPARCREVMDRLFGPKTGGKRCAAGRRNARGPEISKAKPRRVRRRRSGNATAT